MKGQPFHVASCPRCGRRSCIERVLVRKMLRCLRCQERVPADAWRLESAHWTGKEAREALLGDSAGEFQPPGQDLVLVVTKRGDKEASTQGQLAHIILECEDLDAMHEQLLARGVEFANPPTDQMWGPSATFKDPEGTLFVLNQAR